MQKDRENVLLSRRRLLVRIGLVAGAAYVAPAMVGLNAAHASGGSGGSGGGSGASAPSAASAPSVSTPSVSTPSVSTSSISRPRAGASGAPGQAVPTWLTEILPG